MMQQVRSNLRLVEKVGPRRRRKPAPQAGKPRSSPESQSVLGLTQAQTTACH